MARHIRKGSKLAVKLARIYISSSNCAPIHYATCPSGGCATVLAMVAALGCTGLGRLVSR